jgi:uncharacterized DUF497 family protein
MRYHDKFEWDFRKARANAGKHGVTFEDAATVLGDDQADVYHSEVFDDAHSDDEDRVITTSAHPADRSIILIVAWTDRSTEAHKITRIISARCATARERKQYAEEIRLQ